MATTKTTFKKREKRGGRAKGTPNKVTVDTREAFKRLVESNHDNMTDWLKRVAAVDPDAALRHMSALSEYLIPKLARTELTGKDGNAMEITVTKRVI